MPGIHQQQRAGTLVTQVTVGLDGSMWDMFSHYQIPTRREPKQLRSTQSYIYYTDDKKGEGATGSVFGGREKKSGERVAVKVFNNVSYRRPGSVQEREFDVLLKLKHSNIVKLLAIEYDSTSHDRVIVMELCEGGSLFNVLDKPENSFGLAETEFIILLRDVSQGMKHLQDKGIVHRDLKPGNIMCCFGPDSSSVYKLADFGAARELAEGENFVSLYGTEEYLHPDVYERAVLRKPLVRPFTASVDLWSIGVTLFHAATGVLPFRPYGGRKNRATMHQMTTLKASGIISGVQRDSENGRIEWSRELPKTTQMSQGLRLLVEEMLAGLLESDVNRMWSFKTFFDTAQAIVNMTVVDVFYVVTSQLLKIYIDPTHSFAEFQEKVAMQTSLQSVNQMHIFEHAIFYPESNVPSKEFPETTPSNPIFLFKNTFDGAVSPVAPVCPNIPDVQSRYSLGTDAPSTKKSIAVHFCLKRKQEFLLLMQILQNMAVKAFTQVVKDEVNHMCYHLNKLETTNKMLPVVVEGLRSRIETDRQLGRCCQSIANGNKTRLEVKLQDLEVLGGEITEAIAEVRRLSLQFEEESRRLNVIKCEVVDRDALKEAWNKQILPQCQPKDKCIERFDVMLFSQLEIYSNFCRDSKESTLSFNAEQIHKMEKIKFNNTSPKISSLVRDHCESNWFCKHSSMTKWLSQAYSFRQQIMEVDQSLTPLVSEFSREERTISELGERCREGLKSIESAISECTSAKNFCVKSQVQDEKPPTRACTSATSQTSLNHEREFHEAITQTPWIVNVFRTDKYPTVHMVPVTSDLRKEFLEWIREKPVTEAVVKKSQDVTEEMQNMSLDLSDPCLDMYGC
ncbi:serine/threonine-protein kinase TBK1-like isoform X5 [Acanthaster planci]|uniref:IkappaB kinase n=1 Tax=Acanthaster planci TaxID=133434 RepID=A0A8B7YYR5_ACAPL|nr:serine/threonine-protein kinase TBK1-like isoform X5 [Acanthaster planci]